MPKNIALFIDGTWNHPNSRKYAQNTNVKKLYDMCSGYASKQETCYFPGFGTMALEGVSAGKPSPMRWLAHQMAKPINIALGATGGGTSNEDKRRLSILM